MTSQTIALVLEIGPDYLLVATPERRFVRVPRPAELPAVGDFIALSLDAPLDASPAGAPARPRPRHGSGVGWPLRLVRPLALAAALALAVVGSLATVRAAPWWTAAAIVAVDINPSVELAVAGDERVTAARGLDDDGRDLVARAPVVGRAVADAVKRLVAQAAQSGFVDPDGDGLVLVAVAPHRGEVPVAPQALRDAALSALREAGVPGLVAANGLDRAAARAARKAGLGLNAWVVREAAAANGLAIAEEALKRDPAGAARGAAGGKVPDFLPALVPAFGGEGDGGDDAGEPGDDGGKRPGPPGGVIPGGPRGSEGDGRDDSRDSGDGSQDGSGDDLGRGKPPGVPGPPGHLPVQPGTDAGEEDEDAGDSGPP